MRFDFSLSRRACAQLGIGVLAGAALGSSWASDYPNKPVRVVVGFSAGGTTDVVARIMAKELTESLGQSFIVENRPGGGSNIATEAVKAAAPDGYTLLFVAVTSAINQTLYPNVKFDLNRDFEAVALGAKVPNILVVHPSVPANNVKEFIAWARANNDKISYASSGSGTSIHMAGEMFKVRTGLKTQHIPYKGSAPAVTDLIGGQVQFMFDNMPASWPHVQSGKLKALAVTTKTRSPSAPDVPTLEESGVAPFDVTSWFGLIAPKGTPKEVVMAINKALNVAIKDENVKKRIAELSSDLVTPDKATPEGLRTHLQAEVARWDKVIKAAGVSAE